MDTKIFAQLFPSARPDAATWCGALASAFAAGEINTPRRVAHFLGQTGHESIRFTSISESLDYTPERLLQVFGTSRISPLDARNLGRVPGRAADQEGIAYTVYGGAWGRKNLGNLSAADAWAFRGGGLIQLTGRSNYQRVASILGITPEALADQVRTPTGAAMASALWWRASGLNALADADDHAAVTRKVNAASLGAAERKAITLKAASLLGQSGRPAVPVKASSTPVVKPAQTADDLNAAFLASLRG
ncbi:MAG: glycoside hydrolase family 19 [Azospirillum brasilense]|nr:MAG: glycoside hydrolase family 19 [Azospirillum brasilense]